jgi:hypothetical protein
MLVSKKSLKSVSLSFLLCSLYSLCEYDNLFKELNLKNDIFLNVNREDIMINDSEMFNKLYQLSNKKSLRRFVFRLLQPLFSQNDRPSLRIGREDDSDIILFKRYLRKFRYTYYLYFSDQNEQSETRLTEKEINMAAVNMLFLLIGV